MEWNWIRSQNTKLDRLKKKMVVLRSIRDQEIDFWLKVSRNWQKPNRLLDNIYEKFVEFPIKFWKNAKTHLLNRNQKWSSWCNMKSLLLLDGRCQHWYEIYFSTCLAEIELTLFCFVLFNNLAIKSYVFLINLLWR